MTVIIQNVLTTIRHGKFAISHLPHQFSLYVVQEKRSAMFRQILALKFIFNFGLGWEEGRSPNLTVGVGVAVNQFIHSSQTAINSVHPR
jgi:hypothetical protein